MYADYSDKVSNSCISSFRQAVAPAQVQAVRLSITITNTNICRQLLTAKRGDRRLVKALAARWSARHDNCAPLWGANGETERDIYFCIYIIELSAKWAQRRSEMARFRGLLECCWRRAGPNISPLSASIRVQSGCVDNTVQQTRRTLAGAGCTGCGCGCGRRVAPVSLRCQSHSMTM